MANSEEFQQLRNDKNLEEDEKQAIQLDKLMQMVGQSGNSDQIKLAMNLVNMVKDNMNKKK